MDVCLPNILFIPVWYFLARKAVPDAVVDLSALGWAFLAAACAAGAMLLMFFALQSKPATLTVAMTSAYLIVTLFLALVTRAETINIRHVLGIVLIIAGVVVLQL